MKMAEAGRRRLPDGAVRADGPAARVLHVWFMRSRLAVAPTAASGGRAYPYGTAFYFEQSLTRRRRGPPICFRNRADGLLGCGLGRNEPEVNLPAVDFDLLVGFQSPCQSM